MFWNYDRKTLYFHIFKPISNNLILLIFIDDEILIQEIFF